MELHSPVFEDGRTIPAIFTFDGEDISPPLHWSGVPEGTESFALIMEDPDAPSGMFTHWVLYNLPANMRGLDREVPEGGHYGDQAFQGANDFGNIGYGGPHPPAGEHRYIFRLFALDTILDLPEGVTKETLLDSMKGHILAEADMKGLYAKRDESDIELEHELTVERGVEDAYDRAAHYDIQIPEAERRDGK